MAHSNEVSGPPDIVDLVVDALLGDYYAFSTQQLWAQQLWVEPGDTIVYKFDYGNKEYRATAERAGFVKGIWRHGPDGGSCTLDYK